MRLALCRRQAEAATHTQALTPSLWAMMLANTLLQVPDITALL